MTVEYDLVVIGGTPEGRYAAQLARSYGARVALVELEYPGQPGIRDRLWRQQGLGTVARSLQQTRQGYGQWFGGDPSRLSLPWERVQQWSQLAGEAATPDLEWLKTSVDVIPGPACFIPKPQMALVVGERALRSRTYLLATGSQWVIPGVDGMTTMAPLTPDHLWQSDRLLSTPKRLVIVGGDPMAVELAQILQQMGGQVTLAVPGDRLLPGEDRDMARLLLAVLEAEGVRVLTQAPLHHLRRIDAQLWLQLGAQAVEADQVVVAQARQPAVAGLHLDRVGVRVEPWGIGVNSRLQTHHPRIYACGEALGGYSSPALGRYEAAIAVKNALLCPGWRVRYGTVPWTLLTSPVVARVGWTEHRAYQRYGAQCVVLQQALPPAPAQSSPVGVCKLIATAEGHLLGAHIIGPQAEAGISAIALAMQHRIPVQGLARWVAATASGCDWVQQTAAQWPHWRSQPFWHSLLEEWFNLRRG